MTNTKNSPKIKQDFIREIIAGDVRSGKHQGKVVTRFPPEPNGYLHIGHAKSICLNFSAASKYQGVTHLRLDDTNPETEEEAYVNTIKEDIQWLGFDWGEHLYHASDYFDQLYGYAKDLIKKSLAYVDSLNETEIREYRGSVTEPGRKSPFRNRSIEENLKLFSQMKAGNFEDGEHVLRAKIDMDSANMLMRDPVLYRIRHATHYRTRDDWCIYPLYDFTHCLSDSIEGISHSICTLEFENNRELYDWILDNLDVPQPQPRQYEFARLNLEFTVLSKRKLLQLVEGKYVDGWDDPRMPTIAGIRRRGVPAKAIRNFCEMIGVAKAENRVDLARFEYATRHELNHTAPRIMCVLKPLKVVILNYEKDGPSYLNAPYFPDDIGKEGKRLLPFTRELFIEKTDFLENPPKGFRRLSLGEEVRLRYGYIVKCENVVKDENGEILEIHCTYDLNSRSGGTTGNRKVKGTIHWVSATESLPVEIRLYDKLFSVSNPEDLNEEEHFTDYLNSHSLIVLEGSRIEPSVASNPSQMNYQFERTGNFIVDSVDSRPEKLVYNRTVTLKDSWNPPRKAKDRSLAKGNEDSKKKEYSRTQDHSDPKTKFLDEEQSALVSNLISQFGLLKKDATVLSGNLRLLEIFESAAKHISDYQALSKWCINEIPRSLLDDKSDQYGEPVAKLVEMRSSGTISSHTAREIFVLLVNTDMTLEEILAKGTYGIIDNSEELEDLVTQVIRENPDAVKKYQSGKIQLIGYLIGQVMKETQGSAEPNKTKKLIENRLENWDKK